MTKYFCDNCEVELSQQEKSERMKVHFQKTKDLVFDIEIMVGKNGTMNDGMLCHKCIRKIISGKK